MPSRPFRSILVCCTLLASASPAFAGDDGALTNGETRFLKALVAGLTEKSDAVRHASEEALVLMGTKAAGYLVAEAGRVKNSARPAVVRVLVRLGEPAMAAIRALESEPKGRAREVFEEVRRKLAGEGGVGGFGDPDPGVAARVRAIIAKIPRDSFSSTDPSIAELTLLGRPAIPVLLDYLNPSRPHEFSMASTCAKYALAGLCAREDIPRLCRLLDLGWLDIAAVLQEIGDDSCVPAMIRAMERGSMSWELASAVDRFSGPALHRAIIAFLREYGRGLPYGTRTLLEVVAREGLEDALPIVRRMADVPSNDDGNYESNRMAIGRTLALLGDASGLPILIASLAQRECDRWVSRSAGEALNALTGLTHWNKGADPREVQRAYRDWWAENRERLRFDAAMKRYVVRK